MSKLQPFGCMCNFHIPRLMRGASAALKPTSIAGIFGGYSLTFHTYVIFVVYFNPDVFPDDLGGAIVSTNGISTHLENVASPACLHVNKSPISTDLAKRKIVIPEPSSQEATSVDNHDAQTSNAFDEAKRPCISDNDLNTESQDAESRRTVDLLEDLTTRTPTLPKRKELTFPKCPHRDERVDFELGPGFIVEEERSTQNANIDASNVLMTNRNRRKPDRCVAVPASSKGDQMAASAIVLCACVHCLFIRNEGIALAMPAQLRDSSVLPKN